jgi:CRISPR/Cas system-associated exonuclease Cas4 (RecB family)
MTTYSFTQISQYLRCPRQYRYRYLDGWREKEDKAAMMFGRCFENALAAYFSEEDSTVSAGAKIPIVPVEFSPPLTW